MNNLNFLQAILLFVVVVAIAAIVLYYVITKYIDGIIEKEKIEKAEEQEVEKTLKKSNLQKLKGEKCTVIIIDTKIEKS